MTTTTSVILDGRLIESTVDHGDGTATVTRYDDAGEIVSTAQAPLPDVPVNPLADLDPAAMRAAVMAGAALAARASDLQDALAAIATSNTARPAIRIVTDVALTAALTNQGDTP